MQNQNRDSASTLKGPITSVNTLSSPASLLLGFLPHLLLESLWFWPRRTHCIDHRVPPLSLVHSWPHLLDSNDPFVCATSLHYQVSRSWKTSWTLERCRLSKTNFFLVLVLPEFPSGVSCSCFLSWKWSYVPTPCFFRLVGVLKNSPAHTKHFWVRIGIPLCLRVCWSPHSLCQPLWEPLRSDFWPLIEWAQSPETHRCSSICDLFNHSPLACLLSSTG